MPYVTSGGIRIHYTVEGNGPSLVLHPGFMGAIAVWHRTGYVEALKGDYQLVLLDPRGQGRSDKPHEPEAYDPEQRVADVLAVLDDLRLDRAHFFGYSMGGRVGFDLGKQASDRFHSLVIGGQHPFERDPQGVEQQADMLRRDGIQGYIEGFERAVGPLAVEIREEWLALDAEALAAATLGRRPSLETDLPAIQTPALIYSGDQDPAHAQAQRAAELMPHAAFVSLPGLNHMQAIQRSDLVLPHVLAFWQRVGQAATAVS